MRTLDFGKRLVWALDTNARYFFSSILIFVRLRHPSQRPAADCPGGGHFRLPAAPHVRPGSRQPFSACANALQVPLTPQLIRLLNGAHLSMIMPSKSTTKGSLFIFCVHYQQ